MSCTVCGSPSQVGQLTCPTCGAPVAASGTLAPGATVNLKQYLIRGILGRGGFGITYEALDQQLHRRVAIKELFVDGSTRRGDTVFGPTSLSAPDFTATKRGFLEEAKTLASFNDPGIVRVLNFFEDNNTAYLVMEYLDGRTLGEQIAARGALDGRIVETIAVATAQTLAAVHRTGLLHRDIKPDNIFLENSGRVVLIDFGSVRTFAMGQTLNHTRLVTPGYAPLEQYSSAAKFGPYTDIYALGATLHHALTGRMPPPATDLVLGTSLPPLPGSAPASLRHAVKQAMALPVKDRPQNAEILLALLKPSSSPAPQAVGSSPPSPSKPPAPKPTPSKPSPPKQPVPPAPPPAPSPANVLATYLRSNDLTEDLLRDWLYDGSVKPDSLPPDVRQVLIRMSWLDQHGKVPKELKRKAQVRSQAKTTIPMWPEGGPSPTPFRRTQPFNRTLRWLAGLAGLVWCALAVGDQQPFQEAAAEYVVGGVVGSICGYIVGELIWLMLPLLLPAASGYGAYLYATQAALPQSSLVGLPILAVGISFILLKRIRRI